jgi:hypothetical protein
MKLEPELIKAILQWGEDTLPCKEQSWLASQLEFTGFTPDQIVFHVQLHSEERYINCIESGHGNYKDYFIENLTMNGYQYLNLLRSKAWNTAKGIIRELGVMVSEVAIRTVIEMYAPKLII